MNREQINPQEQALTSQRAPVLPSKSPAPDGANTELQAECERLRQAVKSLEEERRHDREILTSLQKERDEYRQALYTWASQQFTEEPITDLPDEKDCLPLDQFIGDLEQIVREAERSATMDGSFRVVYSSAVRTALQELLTKALQKDKKLGRRALEAVRTLDERLRTIPKTFGEPRYNLQHLHVEVRIGIVPPLAVSFAVHESKPVVFVREFQLLAGRSSL